MTIALGATWNPRGEGSRLLEFLPELMQTYKGIAVALPPNINLGSIDVFFQELDFHFVFRCFGLQFTHFFLGIT